MKLFRNLRQKLVKQGNLKKYALYALGEILLVMIGISLAFQVDNWNQNRIKNTEEIRYYENIKDEIRGDKKLIISQRNFNNRYIAQFRFANNLIERNDRTQMDTLGVIIRNLTQYSDFDRHRNIYETLVNSGEIKLLRNDDIVKGIRELEEDYIYINRMESIHYDAMMKHVVIPVNSVIKYATAEIKKPNEIFNYEFQNLLTILLQVMDEKDKVYNQAIIEIENITKLINAELEK